MRTPLSRMPASSGAAHGRSWSPAMNALHDFDRIRRQAVPESFNDVSHVTISCVLARATDSRPGLGLFGRGAYVGCAAHGRDRLQVLQEIHRALGMGRGGENGALVVLEDLN